MKPSQIIISVLVVLVVLSITIGITTMVENDKTTELRPNHDHPLELAAEGGPMPKAVIDETKYEFGSMGVGKKRSHTFVVKNEGDGPLVLKKGSSTCKCTVALLEDSELQPGDSVEIELEWEPTVADKEFVQSATIHTNDPAMKEISLTIAGAVESSIVTFPSTEWRFGEIDVTASQASIKAVVVSHTAKGFDITDVTSTMPRVDCTWEPMSASELETYRAKSGYHVTTEATGPFPIGNLQGELTLHIKGRTQADEVNDIKLMLAGLCRGPLKLRPLTPNVSWTKERQSMAIKSFQATEGTHVRFLVTVLGLEEGQVMKFTDVDSPDNINVTLTHQSRAAYWLDLKIASGRPVSVSSETPLKIKISTTHKKLPEWVLYLTYRSQ